MKRQVSILHLEDDPADAELVELNLAREGIDSRIRVVATREAFVGALEEGGFNLVLADFALPVFDGMTALAIVLERDPDLPFIFVSGRLGEENAIDSLKNGATDYVLKNRLSRLAPAVTRALKEAEEREELKMAEEALRESETRRIQLQAELSYAAQIQASLLPRNLPRIPGFDIAARCLPAKEVGGDFFDWLEVSPGVFRLTLGDVMGKGMAAALLMATVRAAIRAVAQHNRPAKAVQLAEKALMSDLDNSESFVTLFHGLLNAAERSLSFVDCGHGYVFLRRADGSVQGLLPRGLPLGVNGGKTFREGIIRFEKGDFLVLYSDGLIDARPELELDNPAITARLRGDETAAEMVELLLGLTDKVDPLPDDITVLVVSCIPEC